MGPNTRPDANERQVRRTAIPGAHDLNFQKKRRRGKANRGEISHITPGTRSGESAAEFSRRTSKRNLTKNVERTSRIKTVAIVLAIIVAVAFVLYNVATFAYSNAVGGKMQIKDDAVTSALVTPENDTDPYYVLVAGTYSPSEHKSDGADLITLVRVDASAKEATLVSIPGNLVYNTRRIGEVQRDDGDGALISEVSALAGVSIAHYVKVDSAGFVNLIDSLGGIEVDVKQEVDDPDTGDIYIPAGNQTLSGAQALTFARANNYKNGNEDRADNQLQLLQALTQKILQQQGAGLMDQLSTCIKTDLGSDAALSILSAFADADAYSFTTCQMPGATYDESGKENFYMVSSQWQSLMQQIDGGADPTVQTSALEGIDPSDFSVEIRNGGGVTGAGAEARSLLKGAGFKTGKPTNTDSAVYDETLIIYKKAKYADAAAAVQETLGVGRVVNNSVYYSFSKNVLVIVGKDWGYTQ